MNNDANIGYSQSRVQYFSHAISVNHNQYMGLYRYADVMIREKVEPPFEYKLPFILIALAKKNLFYTEQLKDHLPQEKYGYYMIRSGELYSLLDNFSYLNPDYIYKLFQSVDETYRMIVNNIYDPRVPNTPEILIKSQLYRTFVQRIIEYYHDENDKGRFLFDPPQLGFYAENYYKKFINKHYKNLVGLSFYPSNYWWWSVPFNGR